MNYTIARMKPEHAPDVGRLHQDGIIKGFISTLGIEFLTDLYLAIDRSEKGFVFVGLDDNGTTRGFVCGATTVGGVYRSVLFRRGWLHVRILARRLLNPRTLWRILESLVYPVRSPKGLPDAELLSIVVDPDTRGSGIATDLLAALLTEFRKQGCPQIKVLVRADLERANAYYVKHGFTLATTVESHGVLSNIYVIDTDAP